MEFDPKVVPFHRTADYMYHRAMKNRRSNNLLDALELLRQALDREPENAGYRLDLAETYSEMGLLTESNRQLTKLMARPDAPAECFFGMAVNMLGMNDIPGAEKFLHRYLAVEPKGPHADEAERILDEMDIARLSDDSMNRKVRRALRMTAMACEKMQQGAYGRAARMLQRSLELQPEQRETMALLALARYMSGDADGARAAAAEAAAGKTTVKALCVASQVFGYLGDTQMRLALIRRVETMDADNLQMRMLAYALCEAGLNEDAIACIGKILAETPYDRMFLHLMSVAMYNTGKSAAESARGWERIHRIDPDDSVADYFRLHAAADDLPARPMNYGYQLPQAEVAARLRYLSKVLSEGLENIEVKWISDAQLRRIVIWCTQIDHERFTRASLSILAAIDDPSAQRMLREYALRPDAPAELKAHALTLMSLRGKADAEFAEQQETVLPSEEEVFLGMPIGQKQMIRLGGMYLQEERHISATVQLALLWRAYRERSADGNDPVTCTESGAAALAYCYLLANGEKADIRVLAGWFDCPARQAMFVARRIARVLGKDEGHEAD